MNIEMAQYEIKGEIREAFSLGVKCNGEFPNMKDLNSFSEFIKNENNKEALKASIKGE